MGEKFERQPSSWEARKAEIKVEVEQAHEEAPTEEAADKYQQQMNEATALFLAGTMDLETYRATTAKFEALPGFVIANTLPEYRVVLEAAGLDKEEVENILAHENEHMVVAHSIPDVQRKYRLQFMKAGEDQMAMIPSVRIDWSDNLSEEEVRIKLHQATEAPENLSEGDKEMLGGKDSG